jgi:acetate kinase
MSELILVLNCGSSSVKFAVFDAGGSAIQRTPICNGKIENVAGPAPTLSVAGKTAKELLLDAVDPYAAAIDFVLKEVDRKYHHVRAVGHRVVHGGNYYSTPVLITPQVVADLKSYIPLAPLHQPFSLGAVERLLAARPALPQIACFDTAFHQTLPEVERMLPLTWDLWKRGVRRFGFHGLSYEYQSIVLRERYGSRALGRTIVAHLGNGASLCGMLSLKSAATTMGFSALDGLMMGTRAGAIDPGVLLYLSDMDHLSSRDIGQLLYHRSGLLGISGISADPRVLLEQEDTNARARQALSLYVRRTLHEIGAMIAALGGLDLLVFTAGIGEHSSILRERICDGLEFIGVSIDRRANGDSASIISTTQSKVLAVVEPTNEEWIIASHTRELLNPVSTGKEQA